MKSTFRQEICKGNWAFRKINARSRDFLDHKTRADSKGSTIQLSVKAYRKCRRRRELAMATHVGDSEGDCEGKLDGEGELNGDRKRP